MNPFLVLVAAIAFMCLVYLVGVLFGAFDE